MTNVLGLLLLAAAAAQTDKPGSHDYPLIQRFPQTYINGYQERTWDVVEFDVAKSPRAQVGGHKILIDYRTPKDVQKASALEYLRNYENALTSAGWKIDNKVDHALTAHLAKDGSEVWAMVHYDPGYGTSNWVIVEKQPMPMVIAANRPTPPAAGAKPDVAGAKDYDGIPRLPGQRISEYKESRFDAADFEMASGPRHRVEGKKMHWSYHHEAGDIISKREWLGNYRAVLAEEGWSVLAARPEYISAVLRNNERETWAALKYDDGYGSSDLTVVEPAEFKQVVSASNLLERLKREGHVAFEVHFDTGKYDIKDESKPVVQQMVEMLKADPALKVEVQGHTDNTGSPEGNLALSDARAKAVMQALVEGGIDKARLSAKGYGRTKPVADNDTEGGRALNRRVELSRR